MPAEIMQIAAVRQDRPYISHAARAAAASQNSCLLGMKATACCPSLHAPLCTVFATGIDMLLLSTDLLDCTIKEHVAGRRCLAKSGNSHPSGSTLKACHMSVEDQDRQ